MDLSPFTTTPCAERRDGWSAERKLRFLDRLAACGTVRGACGAVGMSRESAYTLRRRDALFARGWATALLLARESQCEVLAEVASEGFEEEVWYRGEKVGTRRRFDARLLLAHIGRLDRLAEAATPAAARDAERFDEILACIAGAETPAELKVDEDALPLARDAALQMAEDAAVEAVDEAWTERLAEQPVGADGDHIEDGDSDEATSDDDYAQYLAERRAAAVRARAEAAARWDAWREQAHRHVDDLLARAEAAAATPAAAAGTVSEVSGSRTLATAIGPDGRRYAYA